jgi:hypothetical protein
MRDRASGIRWGLWIILTLGILLSVYLASPLIALHSIASAVETKDAVAVTERIDFPALRRSLTKQIVQEYLTADWQEASATCHRQALGSFNG